jgi:hypothetical protein
LLTLANTNEPRRHNGNSAQPCPPNGNTDVDSVAMGQAAASETPSNGNGKVNGRRTPFNGFVLTGLKKRGSQDQARAIRDRNLVDRCLLGEVSAWSSIYRQCHNALLQAVRAFLGRAGFDTNLVEEIAARTWYAVVRDDFQLLNRFDVKYRCRLTTFLSMLAKNEARLLLRSERRRKAREQVVSRPEQEKLKIGLLSEEDFIATLSPVEKAFCQDVLFANVEAVAPAAYTRVNHWQLRHRIRRKLDSYLE